jgi:hypothetical protein
MQDYARPGELRRLPAGTASLYRTPWRSNVRTASAHEALHGIGVYYKHIPDAWTLEQHINVMRQLSAAGVKRMRLAPHLAIHIDKNWGAPQPNELETLRRQLHACKTADIRPCVTFVHIPPVGKPGTRELQDWWRMGELLPAGEVGSAEFRAYVDKTYAALRFVVDEARAAGFADAASYDLEMGQNLWWGAPAVPRPMPSTGLSALAPGGRIYAFNAALIDRLRQQGYEEPTIWWGQTHHHFEEMSDRDLPADCAGRAVSIYGAWVGTTAGTWLRGGQYERDRGPNDVWPVRAPLTFVEGDAPALVIARPESYMADRTRRDNLIELLLRSDKPIAITSLGVVPMDIPDATANGFDGWQLKQRGLTRSLAFWLNQGATFVVLHSLYEEGRSDDGEMAPTLLPTSIKPGRFAIEQSKPLMTLRSFCDALAGAIPIDKPTQLRLRFGLASDPVLIPAGSDSQPSLTASDAVVLLPFQIDRKTFAIAAYVMTPNLACRMPPIPATIEVDGKLAGPAVHTIRPATLQRGTARVTNRTENSTAVSIDLCDDVTWLRCELEE